MKKTLLAAALIVGFAGVAQAETSVTMYGILDTGYGYSNYKLNGDDFTIKATSSGLTSGIFNGNRWGVRGSEDLGDGLRAIFTLESGFDIGNGNHQQGGSFFGRQAFVGLASDNWGSLTMGRQYNIATQLTYNVNSSVAMGDMEKTFGSVGLGNRMNNSFKYMTPDFSGFKAGVAYGNPNTTIVRSEDVFGVSDDLNRSNWTSAGLGYENGPLTAGVSYDRLSQDDGKALTAWVVSGAYDFEIVKLALAYGQDRHGKLPGWAAPLGGLADAADLELPEGFRSHNYHVSLSAPLGGGVAVASWSRSSSNLDDYYGDTKSQNIYHLNYNYPLSKRTSVYAYGSYGTGLAYVDNLKGRELGLGLNHKF
uniref:porin n=1 Tax=Castellaniella defragrans TaxID=75697 RepID=UPI003341D3D7